MRHHLYALYLFTKSDIKTVILPQIVFAISSALTEGFRVRSDYHLQGNVFIAVMKAVLWIWVALLLENVANQRLPGSILEDSKNKPWRPFPSKHLTPNEGQQYLLVLVPCALVTGILLGASRETNTLVALIWMYNDLDGANKSIWWRNALNAGGLMCFSAGVTAITAGPLQYTSMERAVCWIALTGTVIFTTVQAQDFPDIAGDQARGRQTMPLLYGQHVARVSLAIGIITWSFLCPWFWGLRFLEFLPTVAIGGLMAWMTFANRRKTSDEVVWKLWCLWFGIIYLLPLLS